MNVKVKFMLKMIGQKINRKTERGELEVTNISLLHKLELNCNRDLLFNRFEFLEISL